MSEQTSEVQDNESKWHRIAMAVVAAAIVLLGPGYVLLVLFLPKHPFN